MPSAPPIEIIIVGAGSAGLMGGRELALAGAKVTLLEARDRIGGRVLPLDPAAFGYSAEGGPEFVHGKAPVTRALVRAAGLSLVPSSGERWQASAGVVTKAQFSVPYEDRLEAKLEDLKHDLPVAEFLNVYFGDEIYAVLRHRVLRMVEGYDAADPRRASTFALRDEWLGSGLGEQARITEGYGALLGFLEADCRAHGATLHFNAEVKALDIGDRKAVVRCADGARHEADAVVVTVPLPILRDIAVTPAAPDKIAAAAEIGFGEVAKILLRFRTRWWVNAGGQDLSRMSFVFSGDEIVPTWWTQFPHPHPVLTGWLAGPRAAKMRGRPAAEIVEAGLASLANMFGVPHAQLAGERVTSWALHWGDEPFSRGAYSYATPESKAVQAELLAPIDGVVFFSGEALYAGRDIGTVEAALACGRETARSILKTVKRKASP